MTVLKEEAAEDVSVCVVSGLELGRLQAVFRTQNRIRIDMFLGLRILPLSFYHQAKIVKSLDFYCFVDLFWTFYL